MPAPAPLPSCPGGKCYGRPTLADLTAVFALVCSARGAPDGEASQANDACGMVIPISGSPTTLPGRRRRLPRSAMADDMASLRRSSAVEYII